MLQEWHAAGLTGFRLRPAALPHDLLQITEGLVPELRRRGLFRTAYDADDIAWLARLVPPRQSLRPRVTRRGEDYVNE